jgi:hypothetical protein
MKTEKREVWMRIGWPEHVIQQGGKTRDVGLILTRVMKAAKRGRPIPHDKFGAHEFFTYDEPSEDH